MKPHSTFLKALGVGAIALGVAPLLHQVFFPPVPEAAKPFIELSRQAKEDQKRFELERKLIEVREETQRELDRQIQAEQPQAITEAIQLLDDMEASCQANGWNNCDQMFEFQANQRLRQSEFLREQARQNLAQAREELNQTLARPATAESFPFPEDYDSVLTDDFSDEIQLP